MHPFPDVYQAFVATNNYQKPTYVSLDGRKKRNRQPLPLVTHAFNVSTQPPKIPAR